MRAPQVVLPGRAHCNRPSQLPFANYCLAGRQFNAVAALAVALERHVRLAVFMILSPTRCKVIAIAEPGYVDGLRLVVHAESRPQSGEMCLHCVNADR